MPKKLTTESFIAKAKLVHKEKYNYNKTEYVNSTTKIIIICPSHGKFLQIPNSHLNGKGCICCGKTSRSLSCKYTTKEFISEAKLKYGNEYDYSEIEYRGTYIPVKIICKKHGEFLQRPNNHLTGYGCPKCKLSRENEL